MALGRMLYCRRPGCPAAQGFTLLELLLVILIIMVISAIAMPAVSSLYGGSCVKGAIGEVAAMIREARQLTLVHDRYYAVAFDVAGGRVLLLSDRGPDGEWNSGDEKPVRSFRLADKGGGLSFGYGDSGPIPGLAADPDGVTLQSNHTLVCNPELTANAGTVYIRSSSGAVMALTMNSRDLGYVIRRWNGKRWQNQ